MCISDFMWDSCELPHVKTNGEEKEHESFNEKHQDSSLVLWSSTKEENTHAPPNWTQTQVKKTYLNFPHAVPKHIFPVLQAERIPKMQWAELVEINIIPISKWNLYVTL